MRDLFEALRSLELPSGEFAVFGSGPLVIRGLVPGGRDLDVICRGRAWEHVQLVATPLHDPRYELDLYAVRDGSITFGNRWAIGEPDIDLLIDTADLISGLPFVRLEHVAAYKRIRRSPRDLAHLRALGNLARQSVRPGVAGN